MGHSGGLIDYFKSLDSRLEVVLFDLDGTLRTNRPTYVESFYNHAVEMGINDGPERRRRAARWSHYYWASSPEQAEDEVTFKEDETQFWINYARRSLVVFDCPGQHAEELAPEMYRYMSEDRQFEDILLPGVPETLQILKEVGLRLGVLSNRNRPYRDYLEQLGLCDYFELALAAGEVGAWKPHPKIFEHAIREMNTAPEQVLYVGDNYFADVVGARQARLHPVLLDLENLFPEADCPVIDSIGELQQLAEVC